MYHNFITKKWHCFVIATIAIIVVLAVVLFIPPATAEKTENEDPWAFALNPDRNYLITVSIQSVYHFGGEYDKKLQPDLITTKDVVVGDPTKIEKAAYVAFCLLKDDLAAKGMDIGLYSVYRTEDEQLEVYNYYSNLEGWAENNTVLPPGMSEHHTGLLLNIVIKYSEDGNDPVWYTETAERQEKIPYFKLLHETLADYGFIDRYPAGKEEFTHSKCEPYEIRFVGSSKIAHIIMDNHLCLEEYLIHRSKYE